VSIQSPLAASTQPTVRHSRPALQHTASHWLVLTHPVTTALAESPETVQTLVLIVENKAGIADDVLEGARDHVERIYRHSGIQIVWCAEGRKPSVRDAIQLTVVIVPECFNRKSCQSNSAMGLALGAEGQGAQRAYIFADRIYVILWGFVKRMPIVHPEALIMGHVIAHEVGHLMLPAPGHTDDGLMRAELNLHSIEEALRGDLLFTSWQEEQMRRVLKNYRIGEGKAN
jgi:hypothetical protein